MCVLAACAGGLTRKDRLDETLRAYESAIRWSQFDVAGAFAGGVAGADPEHLQRLKVTSYEVTESTLSDDKEQAQQTVQIRYYDSEDMRERVVVDRQQWRYDGAEKKWLLKSGLPPFE
jgi:hypothetical protein